jgi:Ca-activated chloride channel family protein
VPTSATGSSHIAAPQVGAAMAQELVAPGTTESALGVWIDVSEGAPRVRPNVDVALVIDTSGSMAGAKMENAKLAARKVINALADGDIVSIDEFSDDAHLVMSPTRLRPGTRREALDAIARLTPRGSTNMWAGLTLAQSHMAQAPETHAVRRVVMISDGIANVGPSKPAVLGALAERGLEQRAQITSFGVGLDYDERTLNALAVRTSGRLYHLSDPREMEGTLEQELGLLTRVVATDAVIEVVPATGVRIAAMPGAQASFGPRGELRIPVGQLHAGQRREALVRVRLPAGMAAGTSQSVASVRLRYRDAAENEVERMQETVARVGASEDASRVAQSKNGRTQAIMVLQEVAESQLDFAQAVNEGRFDDAGSRMKEAEDRLTRAAKDVTSAPERKRLEQAAAGMSASRTQVGRAASAPKAVQRDEALKLNNSAMDMMGF